VQAAQVHRHVPLPPKDDFEFSRNEAEENADALVRKHRDKVSGLI